jgi:O-antigen/teichoic acid export membrane protein
MLLSLPIGAFQTAWGPFAFASFRDVDSDKTFRFVLRAFTCFVLGSLVTLTLAAPLLLKVLAPQIYAASVVFVVWLGLARAVEGMGWITELGISLAKKAQWKIAATALGLSVMVVALGLLMPIMGAMGTALAVLLGIGTKALAETLIAERFHPIGWEWRRVMTMLGIATMFGIHATYVIHPDGTTLAYLGLVATGFTVVAAIVAVAFTADEKAVLNQKIQQYFKNRT